MNAQPQITAQRTPGFSPLMDRESRAMWLDYVASVRADIVTECIPEAVEYMADGGTFSEFLHDECFFDDTLERHFLIRDGIETSTGWCHPDARMIGEPI